MRVCGGKRALGLLHSPWALSNLLTSVTIPNVTHISESSKLTFIRERKQVTLVFLGLSYSLWMTVFVSTHLPANFIILILIAE